MSIRSIHPTVTTLSLPFTRHGRLAFGGRATLVRLSSGSVAVFSPVALTDEVRTAVNDLAKSKTDAAVGYIVAPDLEHHIYLSEWKKAFPGAKIIAPDGLYAKRKSQASDKAKFPNVSDDAFFKSMAQGETQVGDTAFDKDFETEVLHTTPNKEMAFLHKPSRTLIQADLMFNMPPTEQYSKVPEHEKPKTGFWGLGPLGNWAFSHLGRTEGDMTWPRRFVWYAMAGKDKNAFSQGIRRIDSWDFENVIPCHGDTMLGDGKERFRRVFAWHLKDKED